MNKLTSTENSRLKYILECELKEMSTDRDWETFLLIHIQVYI